MSALGRLLALPSMARQVGRLRHLVSVGIRYGFGHVLDRVGLQSLVRIGGQRADDQLAARRWEVRVRLALEELGPTYIKFGQMLATRADLVPLSLIHELRRLHDDVPPFPSAAALALIEAELGRPAVELFAEFDPTPLAAASIAQVHRARLHSGEAVVLKLQRPGLDERLRGDLELLTFLAAWIEEHLPESRPFRPRAAVEAFARSLRQEADFINERRNIERYRRQMADEPRVYVPLTWPALSTRRVLTMEFLDGVKVTDAAALAAWELDPRAIAEAGTVLVVRSIFEHGFFHADPHPGNFFVLRDGRLGLIDFGMMGTLDPERQGELLSFMAAILLGDTEMLVALLGDLGILGDAVDVRLLRSEVAALMGRYHGVDIASVDIGTFLQETIEVVLRHDIELPADLLLVGKAVSTMEGIAREIHPDFNPMVDLRPHFVRLYLARALDPEVYARRAFRTLRDWWALAVVLPTEVRLITRQLRRGELKLWVGDPERERGEQQRERLVNRGVLALASVSAWALFALLLPTAELRGWWSVTTWWAAALAGVGLWTGVLLGVSLLRSRQI